ncbi:MAG: preprotein translocase subunit SecG, partial [Mitsuaria chitosanitabida]|nr:preprotein translocase subunit SecG [Roseateles chitosanitabidus]
LSRSTAVAATIFFVATLALAYMGSHRDGGIGGGASAGEQLLQRAAEAASAPASAAALPGASIAPAAPASAASN